MELLMPAGDLEKMRYALAFGADAVYLGVPRFSLRARENGFKGKAQVIEAIHYAHQRRKKVYVTANILPHNHKVEPFLKYVRALLKECAPDAWILSDPGLIMMMREAYPDQVVHLSVQANTVNFASVRFWRKVGVRRVILSRELSIKEMREIKQRCPDMELEAFVHGAICIAYSGRCLISNYMSYRDPNQGTCSNSCRWSYKIFHKGDVQPRQWLDRAAETAPAVTQHGDPYVSLAGEYYLEESQRPGELMPIDEDENGTYLMNSRDLCGIEYLPEMAEAGITSFKVEGRSKSVYYTALIARAYRRAIDDLLARRPLDPESLRDIFATSNRGLTAGFLKGNPSHNAQSFEDGRSRAGHYRFSGIVRSYAPEKRLMKVEVRNPIGRGMVLELVLPSETRRLTVDNLLDQKGRPVDRVHGGAGFCWIPSERDPGAFALLRECLDSAAVSL